MAYANCPGQLNLDCFGLLNQATPLLYADHLLQEALQDCSDPAGVSSELSAYHSHKWAISSEGTVDHVHIIRARKMHPQVLLAFFSFQPAEGGSVPQFYPAGFSLGGE